MDQLHRTTCPACRTWPRETGVVIHSIHLLAGGVAERQHFAIRQSTGVRPRNPLLWRAKLLSEFARIFGNHQKLTRLEGRVGREREINSVGKIPPAQMLRFGPCVVEFNKFNCGRFGIGIVMNLVNDHVRHNRAWPSEAERGEKMGRTERHPLSYGFRITSSLKYR